MAEPRRTLVAWECHSLDSAPFDQPVERLRRAPQQPSSLCPPQNPICRRLLPVFLPIPQKQNQPLTVVLTDRCVSPKDCLYQPNSPFLHIEPPCFAVHLSHAQPHYTPSGSSPLWVAATRCEKRQAGALFGQMAAQSQQIGGFGLDGVCKYFSVAKTVAHCLTLFGAGRLGGRAGISEVRENGLQGGSKPAGGRNGRSPALGRAGEAGRHAGEAEKSLGWTKL